MNRILLVEDEPTLCDAYRFILQTLQEKKSIPKSEIVSCNSFKDAVNTIDVNLKADKHFDFCILDFRISNKGKTNTENGLEIGKLMRRFFPDCKVLIITSISRKYIWQQIIDEIKPCGFLLKNESDFASISKDIGTIWEGKMVYSNTIRSMVQKGVCPEADLDIKDLKIIHLMSKGFPLPKIAQEVHLSISGLEYRKRKIAEKLGATSSNIQDLLDLATNEYNIL